MNETCHRCSGANVVWAAPSPLWNLVMRGNDITGDPLYGDLVCIPCFTELAAAAGVTGQWRLTVTPMPDKVVTTTPAGRAWDDDRWLWVDPSEGDAVPTLVKHGITGEVVAGRRSCMTVLLGNDDLPPPGTKVLMLTAEQCAAALNALGHSVVPSSVGGEPEEAR